MHLLKDENGNVIPHGDGPAHKHEHDHDHGCERRRSSRSVSAAMRASVNACVSNGRMRR